MQIVSRNSIVTIKPSGLNAMLRLNFLKIPHSILISKSFYKAFVYFGKKVQVDVYKNNGNYSTDDSKYI